MAPGAFTTTVTFTWSARTTAASTTTSPVGSWSKRSNRRYPTSAIKINFLIRLVYNIHHMFLIRSIISYITTVYFIFSLQYYIFYSRTNHDCKCCNANSPITPSVIPRKIYETLYFFFVRVVLVPFTKK